MDLIKNMHKLPFVTKSDPNIVGAITYEISDYSQAELYCKQEYANRHITQRAIDIKTVNKAGREIVLRYSRGSLEDSKKFMKFIGKDYSFIYKPFNRVVYDVTYGKVYTEEYLKEYPNHHISKMLKMLEKAYFISFGDELLWDEEIQILKEDYALRTARKNEVISKKNIRLKNRYFDIQNQYLEKLNLPYILEDIVKSIAYLNDYYVFDKKEKGAQLHVLNIQMLERLKINAAWNIGYLCINKETYDPISITLFFEESCSVIQANTVVRQVTIGKSFGKDTMTIGNETGAKDNLKVLVLEHESIDLDNSIHAVKISGIKNRHTYEIQDTPKQYRNIIMNLLGKYVKSIKHNTLFDIQCINTILHTYYRDKELSSINYMPDSKFKI